MPDIANETDMDDLVRLSVFSAIGTSIVAERSIRGVLDRVMEHVGSFSAPSTGPSSSSTRLEGIWSSPASSGARRRR